MTNLPKSQRFLINRELTPQDIEQMEYWCAVKQSEIERGIKVVNNWNRLKEQENAKLAK